MIEKTLKAFYNEKRAKAFTYNGAKVFVLSDQDIEIEHSMQQAIKIQTTDVEREKVNGIEQLKVNTITSDNNEPLKIISWQYHGNHAEEIIFVLEGKHRGL